MKRYPELDVLRGAAILLMIVYHAAYDLAVFYRFDVPVFDGPWKLLARLTAGLFLLLVGVSFAVSLSRKKTAAHLWHRQLDRFLAVGGCALLIGMATYAVDPETYVRFGILHLIAISALLLPLLRPLREGSIAIGILLFFVPVFPAAALQPVSMALGYPPPGFASIDYFPVLPWFGIVLCGYGLGHFLYVRRTDWRKRLPKDVPAPLSWPGRHSLLLYMIHQPVILAVLWLFLR